MSAVVPDLSMDSLQGWIGRRESARDTVTPQLAQRLAATIESPRIGLEKGQILPQGWYSVLFPRVVPRSQVGRDGHPSLGDFLPQVPLPKRMFAGKRMRFTAPILIGDELERTSEIASIVPKQGSSGPLVFVTIRHTVRNSAGHDVVIEDQDVVYRSADSGIRSGSVVSASSSNASTPSSSSHSRTASLRSSPIASSPAPAFVARHVSIDISADPVMLFRYSALCFNGHRIHYDQPYATGAEGYPALVVNGGLSALCVFEHLHQAWQRELRTVQTRNAAPLFQGETFRVESAAGAEAGSLEFRVVTTTGKVAVAGNAVFTESGDQA